MKRLIPAFFMFVSSFSSADILDNVSTVSRLPVPDFVESYFQASGIPFAVCDDVYDDSRLISVSVSGDLSLSQATALLSSYGYSVEPHNGIYSICPDTPSSVVPAGSSGLRSSADSRAESAIDGTPYLYRPRYQSVPYLQKLLAPLLDGTFTNDLEGVEADFLVYSGSDSSVSKLKGLLTALDQPSDSVVVRAVLYEVTTDTVDSSALNLVASILSGRVGLNVGFGSLTNTLSISTGSFDIVASALSSDQRFTALTSPFVRVKNHRQVTFQVGSDVPVTGETVVNGNGVATTSTDYISSGVLLNLTAHIRGDITDLVFSQEVSSFVSTTVGENENPTLNKRLLSSEVAMRDGEVVVIGGLTDNQATDSSSGLFGLSLFGSDSKRDSQLVMLLYVTHV